MFNTPVILTHAWSSIPTASVLQSQESLLKLWQRLITNMNREAKLSHSRPQPCPTKAFRSLCGYCFWLERTRYGCIHRQSNLHTIESAADQQHIIQVNGHAIAKLDPLGLDQRPMPVELDPALYGFSDKDMDRE